MDQSNKTNTILSDGLDDTFEQLIVGNYVDEMEGEEIAVKEGPSE